MQFSEDELQEFVEIWRSEFGELLTSDEAQYRASLLLDLYTVLSGPLPDLPSESVGGPSHIQTQ
jgi:hypothetical protein